MRAAQIKAYGGQDAVQVNDADKPTAGEGQVLVKVHAAGINPFDWKVRDGQAQSMGQPNFPATLGGDVAGVVTEVGPGVNDFELGQAVYGQAGALSGQGSFAEFTPVKATSLAAKPASLDLVAAAALPLASVSAHQALVEHANLQAGQKILIHGGAGGIGTMAIQLAKHLGAHVATTVAADQTDYVKSLGADEIIDYTSQDFATIIKDYDVVFDTVGGETFDKSYQVLKSGGIIVSMAHEVDEEQDKKYDVRSISQFTIVTTDRLKAIAKLVDAGALKVQLDKVFPLEQAAEALEYQKTGHPKGKVVLKVR